MGFVAYSFILSQVFLNKNTLLLCRQVAISFGLSIMSSVTEPSTDILQSEEFNPLLSNELANLNLISQQFGLPAKPVIKE